MPPGEKIAVKPAKGRPLLTWVGKRPLKYVTAFPAQQVESFQPEIANPQSGIWQGWPEQYPRGGLLFHGDNKEVLAHLLANGFRGKVNLIYIDPPFDSGADYVRKVRLRGASGTAQIDGEGYTLGEQIQYTDIWANDNYLQFMYERLMLMKELLAEDGSIFLHCDQRRNYHLRCLLDEIFGAENFQNEIVREKQRGGKHHVTKALGSIHDTLLHFSKGDNFIWHHLRREIPERILFERYPYEDEKGRYALADCRNFSGIERPNLTYEFLGFYGTWKWTHEEMTRKYEEGEVIQTKEGNVPRRKVRPTEDGDLIQSLWYDVPDVGIDKEYPTEKSEDLLERIIGLASNPGDLILDCFLGSGTTAAVAQKLGRRWIGCDINKGAIQTSAKRLQSIIQEQAAQEKKRRRNPRLPLETEKEEQSRDESRGENPPAQFSFAVYRVNDYDLQLQHNEAVNLACEHVGITRSKSDRFFEGHLGKRLVKIVPFQHPLTPLDLEEIKKELAARPEEERDIVVVCLGKELAADAWLEEWNRLRKKGDVPNKFEVIELRSDPRYGKFFIHKPAQARVNISRREGKIIVEIADFVSPSIIERLQQQAGLLAPQIDDWRAMVDSVMIDAQYNGEVFNIALADVPEKKTDLVKGTYELPAPEKETGVAVKITDMLGEETLVVKNL